MSLIKIGTRKYFVTDTVETQILDLLKTYPLYDGKSDAVALSDTTALEYIENAISAKKRTKFLNVISNLDKQTELRNNLLDNLYVSMRRDMHELDRALFSVKKSAALNVVQIPDILLETTNIVQYGRTDVVGRGEITLALLLENNTVLEPGGKYDIRIDDEYWHIKDATKTGINAATISTMGKRLLWDTDIWPLSMLKKVGLDPMKLSTETIRPAVQEIAKQYVRKYGASLLCETGNTTIAQLFQDDLDKMFRESRVWGEAAGLVILAHNEFHFVNKNETFFGAMSGTGEPEFTLRKDRYKNVMTQELDISWPYEKSDIEFQHEFVL